MSPEIGKNAEKMSGNANTALKGVSEETGVDVPLPEEQDGVLGLFFTHTPSPSATPTPSITPSPSVSPSGSASPTVTPSVSPTPSTSAAVTLTPTPSKSPSPTPFRNGFDNRPSPSPTSVTVFTVTSEAVEISEEGTEVSLDLSTLTNGVVTEDDEVAITGVSFQANFDPGQVNPTERFFKIPGVVRQSGDADPCGYKIEWSTGQVTFLSPPEAQVGQCSQTDQSIDDITLETDADGNTVVASFTVSVTCSGENEDCPTLISFEISVATRSIIDSPTPSPTPVPSN